MIDAGPPLAAAGLVTAAVLVLGAPPPAHWRVRRLAGPGRVASGRSRSGPEGSSATGGRPAQAAEPAGAVPADGSTGSGDAPTVRPPVSPATVVLATLGRVPPRAALLAGGLLLALTGSAAALLGTAVLAVGAPLARRSLRRRESGRVRHACIALCEAVTAELHAGREPADALQSAAQQAPAPLAGAITRAAVAGRLGGDTARELARAADELEAVPGDLSGLRHLAACWRAGAASGAGLQATTAAVAGSLRAGEEVRREVTAALAGPRATAVLLGVLPVLGVVMAAGLGTSPLHVLLGTPLGAGCLVAGSALDATGLLWIGWLSDRVLRRV